MECFGKMIFNYLNNFYYFCKKFILNLWEGYKYVLAFKYASVLNINQFSLICQGCEYAFGCNHKRLLNIPGIQVSQVSLDESLHKVLARSTFHRVLNKPLVLNMVLCRIWQGCEYVRVTQGAEYAWISQNIP